MPSQYVIQSKHSTGNNGLAPIGDRNAIIRDLSSYNTAPEREGEDVLYGPGIRIELPPGQKTIEQMLMSITEEEIAWLVIMRLAKNFEWKMVDPTTGRGIERLTAKPAKSTAGVAQPENLQGMSVDASDQARLREAIELAVDYRGDVTIVRQSTNQSIEGYIFDHRNSMPAAGVGAMIRMIPKDAEGRIAIPVADIASLTFTGKDTASGKTFENWIKKYVQKKTAGETASIESESLDE